MPKNWKNRDNESVPFGNNFQILFTNYMTMKVALSQTLYSKKESFSTYKMEPNIKDNGLRIMIPDMVKATRFGLTEAYMKDIGRMIRPMEEVDSSMQMVIFMMDTGKMIRLMVSGNIPILTEHSTRANGVMTSSTAKVKKSGPMVPSTRGIIISEKSMALDNSTGQIILLIQEISLTTTFKVTASIAGPTQENTQVIGSATRCTAKEYSHGPTRESMKECTMMIRNRVTEYSFGQMVENTTVIGRMVSKRVSAFTRTLKVKPSTGYGPTAREPNGSPNQST